MSSTTMGSGSGASLAVLQKFGRSLMLPIASLPVAGLLLRFGQPDVLGADGLGLNETVCNVIAAAGGALFDWLPLLFALGIAIGMARKSDGSTALAAVIGYVVFKGVTDAMSPVILPKGDAADAKQEMIKYGVLGGILVGLIAAFLWQKYHRVKLPTWLAFFGGRRFVPIITALATMVLAVLLSFVYPPFKMGLHNLGEWVGTNAVVGGFVFGMVNRLLIPLGLHHLLNSVPWFQLGKFEKDGKTFEGDIPRFLAGDTTAGLFQTGFFPIMMFALPAAALAITHSAKPENRKAVGGLMFGAALTAFVTGVTEPLEFAFMFVAWPLYLIHAVLTGASLAICNAFGIRDGFSFSAGLIDYIINFRIASQPLMIIVLGAVFAVIYYFLFRFVIAQWNIKTPGREEEGEESMAADVND